LDYPFINQIVSMLKAPVKVLVLLFKYHTISPLNQNVFHPYTNNILMDLPIAILLMCSIVYIVKNKLNKLDKYVTIFFFGISLLRDGWFRMIPFMFIITLLSAEFYKKAKNLKTRYMLKIFLIILLISNIIFSYPAYIKFTKDYFSREYDGYIRKYSSYGDKILIYPQDIGGYLINKRDPGSFYYFYLPWLADIPGSSDRIINEIVDNNVKIVIYDPGAIILNSYSMAYAKQLHVYLLNHFKRFMIYGRYNVTEIFIKE
jgi:hypothetical protein